MTSLPAPTDTDAPAETGSIAARISPDVVPLDAITTATCTGGREPVTFPEFLTRCVEHAVGEGARPRPGQASLASRMVAALIGRGQSLDEAPTGTGKSLASLAAAGWVAMEYGERTVISTHNLALLDQYVQKDAPAVADALATLGVDFRVAAMKGANNYVDPRRTVSSACELLGMPVVPPEVDPLELRDELERTRLSSTLRAKLQQEHGDSVDLDRVRELLIWALDQYADQEAPGDRQSCTLPVTDEEWFFAAAMSGEAATNSEQGYGLHPKAQAAREAAAEADVVVTNHTLLALQAANQLPIVVGSRKLGRIDHVIVDEAHTLPGQVRSQGAVEVSGRSFSRVRWHVNRVLADHGGTAYRAWREQGDAIADEVERILAADLAARRRNRFETTVRLGEGDSPLSGLEDEIVEWAEYAASLVSAARHSPDSRTALLALRAENAAVEFAAAVRRVGRHRAGVARWLAAPDETGPRGRGGRGSGPAWTVLAVSPVQVAGALRYGLWHQPLTEADAPRVSPDRLLPGVDRDGEEMLLEPLGVCCLSATVPRGFEIEAGLQAGLLEHASPFSDAYAGSRLFVPAVPDEEAGLVAEPGANGRRAKFDTRERFPRFARDLTERLVRANGGRALVLTATSRDGRAMAEHLARTLDVPVLSQWDGNVATVKRQWVADERSVLVGTKSLMTGVDAPGETCSLVVVDRPPRAAGNPVDDARVEALVAAGFSKWDADRLVYVADAATEMKQAAGRLIRAVADRGMVAVLDPRLLRGTKLAYQEQTRTVYLSALSSFTRRVIDAGEAVEFLEARQGAR